jgi:predicted DCC family thiol-disulfide oxidoreductase YuxK
MPVSNGWTGGQYSLFRAVLGTYLFVHFTQLVPWGAEIFSNEGVLADSGASPLVYLFPNVLALCDAPAFVVATLIVAAVLSLLFTLGWYDRAAAVGLWYIGACLLGRNPLIANPSIPFVGWMLLAHAFLPAAPYGSFAARGRADPGGGWHMPQAIFAVAWIVMALAYSYSGLTKLVSPSWLNGTAVERVLQNPLARPGLVRDLLLDLPAELLQLATWSTLGLELFFAPLCLIRRLRPWLWGVMLAMHLGLIALIDFADLSLGMVMLHLFTFDPAWIRARRAESPEWIFYDGRCGLCHQFVRFVLAEDRAGDAFRFAPIGSPTFLAMVPACQRAVLPDSVIVRTESGNLLSRSAAVLHVLRTFGGAWAAVAWSFAWIPVSAADRLYDAVARSRARLFSLPNDGCPVLPHRLAARFSR